MLRVPVYSGVLKLKNVNKKGLCWQAKIARHRFAHGKALSCCYIYISGWIFQKVLAEIVQKGLILSQKALISNRRNVGLFAPKLMRFPSKDSKWKDLSF